MTAVPWLLLIVPVFSTLAGGLLAIRLRRSVSTLLAFGAGLLLGAAFLDLLPEAISLGQAATTTPTALLSVALLSFLFFLVTGDALRRLSARLSGTPHAERLLGRIGGSLLIFHSLRDGMAIGLSYAASHPAGYAVAAGIAAHDIGDGMNTVILTTRGRRPATADYLFLAADCLAPLAGGLATTWWTASPRTSALLLAVAAGFFIQMATNDFLPRLSQPRQPNATPDHALLAPVLLGTAVIYAANWLLLHLG